MFFARIERCGGSQATARRRVLPSIAAALLALAATGFAVPSQAQDDTLAKLVTAAKQEGSLNYYTSEADNVNQAVMAAFTDMYGIKFNYQRAASGRITQRFAAEKEAGVVNADILDVADPSLFLGQADWFVQLSPESVPQLAHYPRAESPSKGYGWLPTFLQMRTNLATVQYNTNLVQDPPKKWEDVLDPKYKGKILLTNPKSSPSYMGWAELMRRRYGIGFLEKLRAQNFKLIDSADPAGQQVAAGAYAISFPAAVTHSLQLIKQGAPINRTIMSDPAYGPEQSLAVPAGSPHPNAGLLFVDFMARPETQNLVCSLTGASSVIAGTGPGKADKCNELPKDIVRLPYADLTNPAVTQPLLDALGIQ